MFVPGWVIILGTVLSVIGISGIALTLMRIYEHIKGRR